MHQLTPNDLQLDDTGLAEFYRCPPEQRWVRANFVSTLDGAAQGPDHRSGSISGASDKRAFALLRALADVILVGAGTARAEKYGPAEIRPEFAALRKAHGHHEDAPPIAVITNSLDLPESLLEDPRTLVFVPGRQAPECGELSERVQVILSDSDWVDLGFVLDTLDQRGYRRISCEGGPRLFAELVAGNLIDELCLTMAPLLLPGDALRVTRGPAIDQPVRMHLAGLLEDDGYLFSRWLRDSGR